MSTTKQNESTKIIERLYSSEISTDPLININDGDAVDRIEAFNLIAKLRKYTYSEENKFTYRDTLEDLLESNGFHFRPSAVNLDVKRYEQIPFIIIDSNNSILYLCIQRNRECKIYCPANDCFIDHSETIFNSGTLAYEVLPVFPQDLKNFWQIIRFAFPAVKVDLLKAGALSIFLTLISLASPIITARVIGDVVPSGDMNLILSTFIVSVMLSLYSAVLVWLQSYYLLRLNQKLSLRIQIPVFHKILTLPVPFLDQYSTGDLTSRAGAISDVLSTLSSSTLSTLISSFALIGYLGLMVYYDALLSVPAIVYIVLVAIIQTILARRQMKIEKLAMEHSSVSFDTTIEILNNISRIRSAGSELTTMARLSNIMLKSSSFSFKISSISGLGQTLSSIFGVLGNTLIYSFVIYRLITSQNLAAALLTTAQFIVFMNAFQNFASTFLQLTNLFNSLVGRTFIQVQRALPIMCAQSEAGLSSDGVRQHLLGEIEFRNVSFSYPGSDKIVLNNVSFRILPGKFNVLFGPSGCGKSTITYLILGFYKPTSGSIFVDGTELGELDLKFFRSQVGTILQSPQLSPSSIKDAISSGINVENESIWRVLQTVNLLEEIDALPMKLETMLCEGSTNISGGQRQRLCIARALLNDPSLLLEDESTSALDNFSQKIISKNLRSLGLTRVVIAHRISAIRDSDHLVIINNGIVETSGTFDHCLKNSHYLNSTLSKQGSQVT